MRPNGEIVYEASVLVRPISKAENYLVISDLQIPFEATNALKFCKLLTKEFNIKKDNILCVGDELDAYFGSQFKKNPDVNMSAVEEIRISRKKLRAWYREFPKMRLAISNHGLRWVKRAIDAEIPTQLIRAYEEIIEAPKEWVWRDEWILKCKYPFRMIHGHGYNGANGAKNAALDSGMSTVIGHIHGHAGVQYFRTRGRQMIWAANSGCLIDESTFAFEYAKGSRFKATLGAVVILDSGKTPVFIPYEE